MTPLTTLLSALTAHPPGRHLTIDDVRDEFDMAQLTSHEKKEALDAACDGGWLTWTGKCQPSTHPPAKSRHVLVYKRTRKALPKRVAS